MRPNWRAAIFALILLTAADIIAWTTSRYSHTAAIVLLVVSLPPWLVVARAIWRRTRHAEIYAILMIAPYLAYGLMEAVANPGARTQAEGLIALLSLLFIALVGDLRLSRASGREPT
jgi:uncharacterized membrane protein